MDTTCFVLWVARQWCLILLNQNKLSTLKSLFMGLFVAGILLLSQIFPRYQYYMKMTAFMKNFHELKSGVGFNTLNSNALGSIGFTFSFISIVASKYFNRRWMFFAMAVLFGALPLFLFSRTGFVAICIAFVVFIILQKHLSLKNAILLFALVGSFLYITSLLPRVDGGKQQALTSKPVKAFPDVMNYGKRG